MPALVTLTTDFGLRDAYVAAMKGTMLGVEPALRLIDVTHEIDPQDVMGAAFVLRQAMGFFPAGTVHLAVVDPGVGSARRALAARLGEHYVVGPDNGLIALLRDGEPPDEAVVLDAPRYWRTATPSATFHGRDIFAPAAAHLAAGAPLAALGSPAGSVQRLHWALPIADDEGVRGWVVHIDRFGNCVTNIPRALLHEARAGRPVKGYAGSAIVSGLRTTYADVPAGEPVLVVGSSDHLEVAVNGGHAASLLTIRKGSPVNLVFS